MSKNKQTLWLFWIFFCAASATFVGYGGCAHAQELSQVVPHVPCPQTALCVKGELGNWIPIWYARDLLKVKEDVKSKIAELNKANEEIMNLRIANSEHITTEEALELSLAHEKKLADIMESRANEAEEKSKRRLRWGVSTGIVGAVVIGTLAAILGTQ